VIEIQLLADIELLRESVVITHGRVIKMTGLHSFDATRLLQGLVRDGFLESHNPGRGAVYCQPGAALPRPEEVFGDGLAHLDVSSAHLSGSSAHLTGPDGSREAKVASEQRDTVGRRLTPQLDAPMVDSLAALNEVFRARLEAIADEPRTKGKVSVELMRNVLVQLCDGHYATGASLAELVGREPNALRQQHLKPLVKEGKLQLAFPTAPTHHLQAYRSE